MRFFGGPSVKSGVKSGVNSVWRGTYRNSLRRPRRGSGFQRPEFSQPLYPSPRCAVWDGSSGSGARFESRALSQNQRCRFLAHPFELGRLGGPGSPGPCETSRASFYARGAAARGRRGRLDDQVPVRCSMGSATPNEPSGRTIETWRNFIFPTSSGAISEL